MRFKRAKPAKDDWNYQQLWRIVDGAVADCFAMHPGYLSGKWPERIVRASICKRVTGSVLGYAEQSAQGRSVEEAAAGKVDGRIQPSAGAGSPLLACAWRRVSRYAQRLWRGRLDSVASP